MEAPKHILISRPDAIGDMMLTLPLAGVIKQQWPQTQVTVLGRNYTRDVVACCTHVDRFLSLDDWQGGLEQITQALKELNIDVVVHALPHKTVVAAAHKAGIPMRIGTGRRLHSILKLSHPHFYSRKKSDLHESQLNLRLLSSLKLKSEATLEELAAQVGFKTQSAAPHWATELIDPTKKSVILHPLSSGSAFDWPLEQWVDLCHQLDPKRFQVFVTGTASEGEKIQAQVDRWPAIAQDLTGRFTLSEFIGFIASVDALVACSTGPLHLAAALEREAIGLYPTLRPMHAGRWAPLGPHVHVLESTTNEGMRISVETVASTLGH